MPGRAIQHIDLAVADVERSLAFYRMLLEPLGLTEYDRVPSYRGTEEVVYLQFGRSFLGLRSADGGIYRHEFVADTVIKALMDVQLKTEVPIFSAVLTPQQFHESAAHFDFFRKHFATKGIEVAEACANTLLGVGPPPGAMSTNASQSALRSSGSKLTSSGVWVETAGGKAAKASDA